MLLKTLMIALAFFCKLHVLTNSDAKLLKKKNDDIVNAQKKSSELKNWKKIASYFNPPPVFKDNFGDYRSPLAFYDGRLVESKTDWKARRIEIKKNWMSLMGEWPKFIETQNINFVDTIQRDGFTQYTIIFNWTINEKTKAYLCIPNNRHQKKMPAIITTYYEPETAIGLGKPDRDFAYQLTKRGFITLSIGTTEATKAKTYSIFYPSLQRSTIQPLSMLAYAAANAWFVLANLKVVDEKRIGIMGHSFGGKWAMFASCLFDKFACAVWSDPGIVFDENILSVNYWEPWYLGYHQQPWRPRGPITKNNPAFGLYPKLIHNKLNLHELHALMAPRPFLVSGGEADPQKRWEALNHTIKINELLGYKNKVAMTNRPLHAPNAESNEQAYSFLTYFLKP